MNPIKKLSKLSIANAAMRAKDYAKAIDVYQKAMSESPMLHEQLIFNIAIAKARMERAADYTNTSDHKTEIQTFTPSVSNFSYTLIKIDRLTPAGIRGHIDVVDEDYIHGWLYDIDLAEPLSLDLYIDDVKATSACADIIRKDVLAAGELKAQCGFKVYHGKITKTKAVALLTLKISGTTDVHPFPVAIETMSISAETQVISKVAQQIKRELIESHSPSLNWLSSVAIPDLMERLRSRETLPTTARTLAKPRASKARHIDVIIPVYEGLEETLNCINSVLNSKNTSEYNLVVINDCSPNNRLTKKLKSHAEEHDYILITNEQNLGFVGTVNRGIQRSDINDVILLNSDTLVPSGWIDQIATAAYSDPAIGTVTPFSNNATICSYPSFCQDNELPDSYDVERMNRLFKILNSGSTIDLPTAHGFCVFIKRDVIDEIGLFDEKKWGKGYAEENDFSLRADKRGWRNVMALDTFVQHLGSVSFASNTTEFIKKNLTILNGIYPDYSARVADFIRNDPARTYRNRVSKHILESKLSVRSELEQPIKSMLIVTLTIGGGTQIATDEISAHLEREGVNTLYLTCPAKNTWRLTHTSGGAHIDYVVPNEMDVLIEDLRSLNIWHVNYHNTIEFGTEVWTISNLVDCEFDATIHDYLTICPRVNLIGSSQRYCGEPQVSECNKCIIQNGVHESSHLQLKNFGNDVKKWREFFGEKLTHARKVFVPSNDVARRMERYFPDIVYSIRPHPEPIKTVTLMGPIKGPTVNVAFLGAIGTHKGYDYLIGCAAYALEHHLPLKFHVIGYTKDDNAALELSNIQVHGKYSRDELPNLLKASKCNVAAILSVWPETFSYTFSEAVNNGLKIVTFNFGAPSERLKPGCGSLVDLKDDFGKICRDIIDLSKTPATKIKSGQQYDNYLVDYYGFASVTSGFK